MNLVSVIIPYFKKKKFFKKTLESVLNSQRQYNSIQSQYLTIRKYSIENRLSLILAMGGDFEFDVAE